MPTFAPHGYIRSRDDLLVIRESAVTREVQVAPYLSDDDWYVTSVVMQATAYTLAHTTPTETGGCRNVTVTHTTDTTTDTLGDLTVVGTDKHGNVITEDITIGADATTAGLLAFASITSATTPSWVQAGGVSDLIEIGFGDVLGLDNAVAAAGDVLVALMDTTAVTSNAVCDGTLSGSTVDLSAAVYDNTKVPTIIYRTPGQGALTATGLATVKTMPAFGYAATVEEFGFDVENALAGAGGSQIYDLKNGTHVLATITITLALGIAGANIATTTITKTGNWHKLQDANVLTISRRAGGTAFTSGTGRFYVRLAQRAQKTS